VYFVTLHLRIRLVFLVSEDCCVERVVCVGIDLLLDGSRNVVPGLNHSEFSVSVLMDKFALNY
jgi:hypothetical protein